MRKLFDRTRLVSPADCIRSYARHPYISLLALLGMVFTVIEVSQIGFMPVISIILYGCIAVAFTLLPLLQVPMCWLVILAGFCLSWIPSANRPFIISGMLIALGILAFLGTRASWILAMAVCSLSYLTSSTISGYFDWYNSFSVAVMFFASLLTGRLVAIRQQAIAEEKHRLTQQVDLQRLEYARQRNQLAIQIHDSLTNDLSDISLIARNHTNGTQQPTADWTTVLERSQQAFARIHAIIDLLSDRDNTSTTSSATTFVTQLQLRAEELSGHLNHLGYGGRISIEGLCLGESPEEEEEILSLTAELCNNIQRHSMPGEDVFEIHIKLSQTQIDIHAMNDFHEHHPIPDKEQSGRGLTLHTRRVGELGGDLTYRGEDGLWILYASIPWKPKPS